MRFPQDHSLVQSPAQGITLEPEIFILKIELARRFAAAAAALRFGRLLAPEVKLMLFRLHHPRTEIGQGVDHMMPIDDGLVV